MPQIKPGPGFTVFLLFFALALIDAIRIQDWLKVSFWIAIGLVFLLADSPKKRKGADGAPGTKKPL